MAYEVCELSKKSNFSNKHSLAEISISLKALGHIILADEVASYDFVQSDKTLRVTVLGEYSAGKSTLINALLGARLLASSLQPTTGIPAEVRYGKENVTVLFNNGQQHVMSLAEADGYSNIKSENRSRHEVDRIIVSTTNEVLKNGVTLIDTPGILDDDKQTERARREIASADIVLLVLKAHQLLSAKEREFAIDWLTIELGKPIIPVVNFMGRVSDDDREEVRKVLHGFVRNIISPLEKSWYEVDALSALRHHLGVNGSLYPSDDYFLFRDSLRNLTIDKISEIKSQANSAWCNSWKKRAFLENFTLLRKVEHENLQVIKERDLLSGQLDKEINRLRGNLNGYCIRAVDYIESYKTNRQLAISRNLPPVEDLSSDAERQNAIANIEKSFNKAVEEIDENANIVLMDFTSGTDVIPLPISIRELVDLKVKPEESNDAVISEWAIIGGVLGVGAVIITGAFFIAILVAIFSFVFGVSKETNKESEQLREKLKSSSDAALEELKSLLRDQFNANAKGVVEILEKRKMALINMPNTNQEIAMRRQLSNLLKTI